MSKITSCVLASFLVLLFQGCTASPNTLLMYSSSDSGTTWTSSTVEIADTVTDTVVDPSPILMSDGSILIYYLSANGTDDPFTSQPDNIWRMAVAKSTDDGKSFTQMGLVHVSAIPITDPFPLRLTDNRIRLLMNNVDQDTVSVTTTGTDGLVFDSSADSGIRSTSVSIPGALEIAGTYYLYGCGSGGISYETSVDGLTFTAGGTAIPPTSGYIDCDPSPVFDPGSGNYVMAYKRKPMTAQGPSEDTIRWAQSPDGITWTDQGEIGDGSVPGLVIDQNGVWRIYAPVL